MKADMCMRSIGVVNNFATSIYKIYLEDICQDR